MTDHNSIIRAFQRREAAEARAQRRLADALNGTAPTPRPLDTAEHARLFDEAREARRAAALGGEVPEHLAAHAEVIEAENVYAAALRQAQPAAFKNDDDLEWVARNKRADLIREHQFASGYTDEVLARVAEGFRTAAQALTRPAPPRTPATSRTTAAEATPGRRIVRVTEQVRPTIR
ncbi:hypothetical protein M3C33_009745 [Micrococcus luteus]|nr:hypothetical protein [Micrococcus luteus]TFI12038.1 hypothetical protein E4P35_12150 [Thiopseudomonas sp. 4R-3cl]MCV7459241.1 hypothetical protein [Micrococcus luteus]MCV7523401.1 hypothetical protein [Micrococcus luteus]MCV7643197.1 hypothetical protein [Micrococcus luteus]